MTTYNTIWEENPLQIISIPTDRIIALPEKFAGRGDGKRSKEEIKEKAASIKAKGQLQPVICGINDDEALGEVGAPILYMGFGRYEACKTLDMPLLCMYSPMSPKDTISVLTTGMHENTVREDLSAVQVAANIGRLRESGMKDNEIARELGKSPGWVSNHARFLANEKDAKGNDTETPLFSKFALSAINKKSIPQRAAIDLYDLGSQEAIDNAVKELLEAEKTGVKITSDAVRDVVRKKAKRKKKKNGKEVEVSKARRLPEVKALFDMLGGEGESRRSKGFASLILGFIAGEGTTEDVAKRVVKLLNPATA